jgi:hypothetical protein
MPLKVIGAGLPRTSTLSLKLALEQLGFGPCFHMTEMIAHPELMTLWADKLTGKSLDWDDVLKGYHSITDGPGCFVYKELMERYPDAKVILSLRTAESWWESALATVMSANSPANRKVNLPNAEEFMEKMQIVLQAAGGGIKWDGSDREGAIAAFERHNAEVQRFVPKERLLVFKAEDGWEPLCRFLGAPVPGTPYPRTNSTEDLKEQLAQLAGE